jgi:hypothetical protein
VPESEYIWPRLAGIWRANQVATVPESDDTMVVEERRFPSSQATTWGFMGLSVRVPRSSISCHQSFIPDWAASRKWRAVLRWSSGSNWRSVRRLSPTRPTSTG